MNDMVKLSSIPKYNVDMVDKCKVCMQTKKTRQQFPKIEKTNSLLELVHSDIVICMLTPLEVERNILLHL